MAIHYRNLSVSPCGAYGGADGSGAVAYCAELITNDAVATVEAVGYFNTEAARLPVGTVITARMVMAGAPVMKHYIVTANNGTVVTIAVSS